MDNVNPPWVNVNAGAITLPMGGKRYPWEVNVNAWAITLPMGGSRSVFLTEGLFESKNLFSESCLECPITYGLTPFQVPWTVLKAHFEVNMSAFLG